MRLLLLRAMICVASVCFSSSSLAQSESASESHSSPSLSELKATGLQRSRFRAVVMNTTDGNEASVATGQTSSGRLGFEKVVQPLLGQHCLDCHSGENAEGDLAIDSLDADLINGEDADAWSQVFAVVTKGEMPPPEDSELLEEERRDIVDWLSAELRSASVAHRKRIRPSGFRRMTRYEYNYALQDMLGLPWDFAKDLPPEAHSEDGFENSEDLLRLSVSQFEMYRHIARRALQRAVVVGDKPSTLYWNVSMKAAADREWPKQDKEIADLKEEYKDEPEKLKEKLQRFQKPPSGAYYKDLVNDRFAPADWRYHRAQYAFKPENQPGESLSKSQCVAIVPQGLGGRLIVELGNQLPDEGTMRVTVSASRANVDERFLPSLQLMFGWQASNEGRALLRVSDVDTLITATPDEPQTIQWDVPLGEIYPRNSVRKTSPMGSIPSPSEYIRLFNSSALPSTLRIDHVQVAAPVFDQWPPESHQRIFDVGGDSGDDAIRARAIIRAFMQRAWRRPIDEGEIEQKLRLYSKIRPECESFEETVVEVLAVVLSSPQFLFVETLPQADVIGGESRKLDSQSLAARLATFLWCSIPDDQLFALAESGELSSDHVLDQQVDRMLADPRGSRFVEHFVHQWLDMQLLEFQSFKQHIRHFDPLLKEAMMQEPAELFREVLRNDASVLDFLHCDYAMLNERLARHYGINGVGGNHFQRVQLGDGFRRGGLLTQAGVLAMNSDYPDSHPLKRAIWLLESILADPPPPPPPAVPQIDLADPEIAKMTLKERIEDHRNHAACMSCHVKIDPWGIAFENYDALGKWRDNIKGKPVDASSELFNHQTLDGMDGLKRFLLEHRQDQFVRAFVSKLATYALGRSMTFADQAELDAITARVRQNGDGLQTIIKTIVQSDLFRAS